MDSFICRIELNKNKGITIVLQNDEDNILQTITMDGTSITFKVKGSKNESVIIQKEEEIFIKCKDFKIEAETINCKSKKETYHESGEGYEIKSKKDLVFDASSDIKEKASGDIKIEGKKIEAEASSEVSLEGTNIEIKGKNKSSLSGGKVDISSKGKLKVKGGLVEVSSKGLLDVKTSGILNIKGSLLNLKATLVRFG